MLLGNAVGSLRLDFDRLAYILSVFFLLHLALEENSTFGHDCRGGRLSSSGDAHYVAQPEGQLNIAEQTVQIIDK